MDLKTVKKRAIRGAFSLTIRRIALLGLNFITLNVILAKILPVSTLGIFNIANSIIAFFTFFSDIGLAAAMIRKKDLKKDDLKTTFTIQEILALIITLIVWFFAPILATTYHLEQSSVWLIRALSVGFFLSSLKVIPSVILERELDFGKLVWVELLETIVFNGMLIWFSLQGFGIDAFTYSVVARGIIGLIVIYILAPWPVSFGFSKSAAKELFSFGVPFQLNSFLALLKDRLVQLIVAGIIGSVGVGFIGQGQRIAFFPLEVMNIITRVTFPTFSRLQHDSESLKKALERSLFATGLFLYPLLFGVLAVTPSFVKFIGEAKWGPVMPLIYLFSVTAFWATLSSPFTNFLNAIGKINITLKLMVMWTILDWGLTPFLAIKYGFVGVGIASAIISFSSIIPLIIIKRMIKVQIIENIWQPLVASILMSIIIYYLSTIIIPELPTLIIMVIAGAIIYFTFVYIIAREKIKESLREFINAFSNR
jgi:O-antigen/teichoic acid export membrane protein